MPRAAPFFFACHDAADYADARLATFTLITTPLLIRFAAAIIGYADYVSLSSLTLRFRRCALTPFSLLRVFSCRVEFEFRCRRRA